MKTAFGLNLISIYLWPSQWYSALYKICFLFAGYFCFFFFCFLLTRNIFNDVQKCGILFGCTTWTFTRLHMAEKKAQLTGGERGPVEVEGGLEGGWRTVNLRPQCRWNIIYCEYIVAYTIWRRGVPSARKQAHAYRVRKRERERDRESEGSSFWDFPCICGLILIF